MTLCKKISIAFFPIILIGGLVATLLIYYPLKTALLSREQAALSHRAEEAASIYRLHQSYVSQQLYLVEKSQTLQDFLSPSKDKNLYTDITLANSLQHTLQRIFGNLSVFSSLAILNPDGETLYYYENSDDPFAGLSSTQRGLAKQLFADAHLRSENVYKEGAIRRIVNTVIIDRRIEAPPITSSLDQSVIVQVAVCLKTFEEALSALEARYNANILFQPKNETSQVNSALTSTIKLDQQYSLTITPSDSYLNEKFTELRNKLASFTLTFLFIVISVYTWIIRTYGIKPIETLTAEVQKINISNWGKGVITGTDRKDEIGILANRFQDLLLKLSLEHDQTTHLAKHDALTQLPNRRSFNHDVNELLANSNPKTDTIALLYIDLDNFKFVNDRHGHAVGDAMLTSLAKRMRSLLNSDQTTAIAKLGRLAGDEFAIALPTNLNSRMVNDKAEQILALFANGYHFDNGSFPVTASIGIAYFPEDGDNAETLENSAYAATCQSKTSGKNQFQRYSNELAVASRKQHDIEFALKSIDFNEEFHLVYMPICDEQRRIVSCEALLRWHSPVLGNIGPDEFIPIAESTGLFRKIDYWVIKSALRDFAKLDAIFGEDFTLSINLSSAELESEEIAELLDATIKTTNIEPSRIELELTETFAVTEGLMSIEILDKLVLSGFQIAIDDFGTGHTSLLQLVEYPIHKIKFDRTFVNKIMASSRYTILEPLITLCHSQGFLVTAEGIENEIIAKYFAKAGCDYFQGYLYSKPKTLDELHLAYPPLQQSERFRRIES